MGAVRSRRSCESDFEYMGGIWKGLGVFLENPAVDLDNNRTERALRGVVLGRMNHYGSRSVRGTEVASLFHSLSESAKSASTPATTCRRPRAQRSAALKSRCRTSSADRPAVRCASAQPAVNGRPR